MSQKFVSVSVTPEAREVVRLWAKELQRESGDVVSFSEALMEMQHRGESQRAELERLRRGNRDMSVALSEMVWEEFPPSEGWGEFVFSGETVVEIDGQLVGMWEHNLTAVRGSRMGYPRMGEKILSNADPIMGEEARVVKTVVFDLQNRKVIETLNQLKDKYNLKK